MDRRRLVEAVHGTPALAVLAVTGGGASLLSELLVVPGASRTVLEAVVPYSEAALESWVGGPVTGAASAETAARLAVAALERAAALAGAEGRGTAPLVGLGLTAALASDRPKRGEHRAHLACRCRTAHGVVTGEDWSLTLDKGRRSRAEEDDLVAAVGLVLLARACGLDAGPEVLTDLPGPVALTVGDRLAPS